MKKPASPPYHIRSIAESHRLMNLPKPGHPLISLIDYNDIKVIVDISPGMVMHEAYLIAVKNGFTGKIRYGQKHYEFDEGEIMSFLAPRQVVSPIQTHPRSGYMLFIHPDFLRGYALEAKIKNYGFFSYQANQALQLSQIEASLIKGLMENLGKECQQNRDEYNQDIIISYIELLLNLANRYYNRLYLSANKENKGLLVEFEALVKESLNSIHATNTGLPTVQFIAQNLHVSPGHLSDLLRTLTGKSAQHYIQECLIEKAKEMLSGTAMSVSEIAYQLGFGHPQSFSKFFKVKTNQAPINFRRSFFSKAC